MKPNNFQSIQILKLEFELNLARRGKGVGGRSDCPWDWRTSLLETWESGELGISEPKRPRVPPFSYLVLTFEPSIETTTGVESGCSEVGPDEGRGRVRRLYPPGWGREWRGTWNRVTSEDDDPGWWVCRRPRFCPSRWVRVGGRCNRWPGYLLSTGEFCDFTSVRPNRDQCDTSATGEREEQRGGREGSYPGLVFQPLDSSAN